MMVNNDDLNKNNKLHSLEVTLNELKNDLQIYKDKVKCFKDLREDFLEIRRNKNKHPSEISLTNRYFDF